MFRNNGDEDVIEDCIKKYILSSKEIAFSLNDFAMRLTGIYKEICDARNSRNEVNKLLAETKKRMENQ